MEDLQDMVIDMVEYLAVLVSPSPKDTMKAIEKRRKADAIAKKKSGQKIDGQEDTKLFKDDHRNTTFFDEIAKMVGEDTANAMKKDANVGDDFSAVEEYELDMEDLDFIQKANNTALEQAALLQQKSKQDQIEF
jgi:hypothetical protein